MILALAVLITDFKRVPTIDIKRKYVLPKVFYVPSTSAAFLAFLLLLLRPLMGQTRQAVHAIVI
jgi:hypothetical protein